MANKDDRFRNKYGPWALVAGASVGLGAAYASELAQKGLNLVLVARRPGPLQSLVSELESKYGVKARAIEQDLASPDMLSNIASQTDDIEVGLVVYDTAYLLIGDFFEHPLEKVQRLVDVNCQGPITLSHYFGQKMIERKRGGIILMSSLSGFQGAPWMAGYGATKAFNIVLAEGLWYELKDKGIDVLVCTAGAISTPNYDETKPEKLGPFVPKALTVEKVAHDAIAGLGKKHIVIPGRAYRFSNRLMGILPRKWRMKVLADSTKTMYGDRIITVN
jgi:short-subunit dehydrogenase